MSDDEKLAWGVKKLPPVIPLGTAALVAGKSGRTIRRWARAGFIKARWPRGSNCGGYVDTQSLLDFLMREE